MKVAKVLLLTMLIASNNVHAQLGTDHPVDPQQIEKNTTPVDPTVGLLGKFAMQPPNYSNGVVQQNIPLHTIKENGIEYPLSVSYSFSGFEPAQEASNVGLGWALSEGVITRIVKGLPDDNPSVYKKFEQMNYFNLTDEYGTGQVDPSFIGVPKVLNYTANRIYNKLYDGQPDVYVFNFNGHSGRFLFLRDTAYIYPYGDYHITKSGTDFIIATPDGLEYTFQAKDWTTTFFYNSDLDAMTENYYGLYPGSNGPLTFTGGITTTAWRLTKIVNKTTQATISFTYSSYSINKTKYDITAFTFWNDPRFPSVGWYHNSYTNYTPPTPTTTQSVGYYLTGIISDHETVSFKFKDRLDYDSYTTAKAIDEIDIYSNLNIQAPAETIKFTQDYFTTDPDFSNADNSWLKLTKLTIAGEGDNKEYDFSYNGPEDMTYNPTKSGYSLDHWGYYNGVNNQYLVPQTSLVNPNALPEGTVIPWANRNPDFKYAKLFALSQVKYPTGGYSNITYESAGGRGIRVRSMEDNDGTNNYKKYFEYSPDNPVPAPSYNFSSYTLDHVQDGIANATFVGPDTYLTVTAGTKSALDFFDDNSNFYSKVTEYIGTPDGQGGKTIYNYMRDYSSYNPYLTETDYYRYNESMPFKKTVNTYEQTTLRTIQYYTDPYVYTLGNRAVYVEGVDGPGASLDSPLDILDGYHYFLSDMVTSHFIIPINWFKLTQTDDYEYSSATAVNSTKYYYRGIDQATGWPVSTNVVKAEHTLSNTKVATTEMYYPGDTDPDNSGTVLGTPEMWNKNNSHYKYYISPVLKTKTFVNNNLSGYSLTNFQYNSTQDLLLMSSVENHPSGTSAKETWIFTYDNKANIISTGKENDLTKTFVWDYNLRYPIAEIINGSNDNVAATSFEADGTGNWTISSSERSSGGITGKYCYDCSKGAINKTALNSAITYIVSYWTTNNDPFTIAGTQGSVIRGKKIGNWTYFEHKITGASQVAIPQNTGLIDELRLYPADAQMTTYTYEPFAGITSKCIANNTIVYYEYDEFSRLKLIRDQDGNIVKTFKYNYKQ